MTTSLRFLLSITLFYASPMHATIPNDATPVVSKDFCMALMSSRVATQGGGIDASGNSIGATHEVAAANLSSEEQETDDLGRQVARADLNENAFKLPEVLTMPLSFAVSKAPKALNTQTESTTTGAATLTDASTTATQATSTTTQNSAATANTTAGNDATTTNTQTSTTTTESSATTTGSQTSASTAQTQSTTTGTLEGFDKTAQLWISIHKDGRLELEGQPLKEDETRKLYAACEALSAQAPKDMN